MAPKPPGPKLEFREDGSAVDPAAVRAAIMADAELAAAVAEEPHLQQALLLGGDDELQAMLREIMQEELQRRERFQERMGQRTIDAQRASATVPRDTVQVYKQLADAGLQYGPAFRLLRNVHVPDVEGHSGVEGAEA